jgi:crotonobetainyl-CoA:carnitine CoA-transferase CaiB-like acyl-CoA transferase
MASPPEVVRDPAVIDNGYLMPHPNGRFSMASAPAQFDGALPTVRRPGPELGEHSREVLLELGYSAADVDKLAADDVVIAR